MGCFSVIWHVQPIISYQMNIQRNLLSFSCLAETLFCLLIPYSEPKIQYLGNDVNVLSLEAMKNMFEIAATNLKLARERGDPKDNLLPNKLQPRDTVLVQKPS